MGGGLSQGSRARRGSYFFVIDAFIAAAILTFTLVIIFNLFVEQQDTRQTFTYAHDFIEFLTDTEARDFDSLVIDNLIAEGRIEDASLTLAQQLAIFYYKSKVESDSTWIDNASSLIHDAVDILPPTLQINVTIREADRSDRTSLYERDIGILEKLTHLSSRSIEYILVSDTEILGPYLLEVEVWS